VGLLICCPITNQEKGYPFEVKLPEGVGITGAILSDQVKSLDWKVRQATFIVRIPDDIMIEVIGKLGTLLR
jgi:mRNA interferase MazF